jgi:hypothetical protein
MAGYEIVLTFKPGLADPEQVDHVIAIVEAHHCYVGGGGDDEYTEWVLSGEHIVDIVAVTVELMLLSATGQLPSLRISDVPATDEQLDTMIAQGNTEGEQEEGTTVAS